MAPAHLATLGQLSRGKAHPQWHLCPQAHWPPAPTPAVPRLPPPPGCGHPHTPLGRTPPLRPEVRSPAPVQGRWKCPRGPAAHTCPGPARRVPRMQRTSYHVPQRLERRSDRHSALHRPTQQQDSRALGQDPPALTPRWVHEFRCGCSNLGGNNVRGVCTTTGFIGEVCTAWVLQAPLTPPRCTLPRPPTAPRCGCHPPPPGSLPSPAA